MTVKVDYIAATYLRLVADVQDKHGFLHTDACDSLLFTALAHAAGMPANLWAAHDHNGWHRRPVDLPECCPNSSKSQISRDMWIGLMIAAWSKQDLRLIQSVLDQMNRFWRIPHTGLEGLSRVIPTPGLYATAKMIESKLLGTKAWRWWNMVPYKPSTVFEDYRDHLGMLHVFLRSCVTGNVTKSVRDYLEEIYYANMFNPLAIALHQDPISLTHALSSVAYWLPTNHDRKAPWLPERFYTDYGPDYSEKHSHSGMDLVFCLWAGLQWHSLNRKR
jgi:hypothetical protein